MKDSNDYVQRLEEMERVLKSHPNAEIKNIERLRTVPHSHTAAMCEAATALLKAFRNRKTVILVEAEISELGCRARPEDLLAWIEGIGLFVIEVKSHTIEGIRRFENNVPQVVYQGQEMADVDLLDQPKDFAYKLKSILEKTFDEKEHDLPPLYYAGWLPNVSPEDVAGMSANVASHRVWLSDMLDPSTFETRLSTMKNLTNGVRTDRSSLETFCGIFGATSGLHRSSSSRPARFASIGHQIDRKNLQLKKLTKEQEDLAFSPNLLRGPKVIRGVAGSGKTVVLANAVAEAFVRATNEATPDLFGSQRPLPEILVLCYNRVLAVYILELIRQCFDARKPRSEWIFPASHLKVMNIDRYAFDLAQRSKTRYNRESVSETVSNILGAGPADRSKYQFIFIDEGQDIDLEWYSLIRELAKENGDTGKSIIVFYDEAQNLYGTKRPGTGDLPAWKELLGEVPNPRGLSTIMRVGHRNTNQVLSLSFNLLLGGFAEEDPQMLEFSGINEYTKLTIPEDVSLDHPRKGSVCVEKIDNRQYRVNFAVHDGPPPDVNAFNDEREMLAERAKEIEHTIHPDKGNVDKKDVLVMVPEKRHVKKVSDALAALGIPAHIPVNLYSNKKGNGGENKTKQPDPRDLPFFQDNKITVSTIKSAKGHTAHVCHVAFVHALDGDGLTKERKCENRAQLHVACTRSSLLLGLWGTRCPLMNEAEKARTVLG